MITIILRGMGLLQGHTLFTIEGHMGMRRLCFRPLLLYARLTSLFDLHFLEVLAG